jgi:hypothetical protein
MRAALWFFLCCLAATASAVVTVLVQTEVQPQRDDRCINSLCECGVKPKRFVRHYGVCE